MPVPILAAYTPTATRVIPVACNHMYSLHDIHKELDKWEQAHFYIYSYCYVCTCTSVMFYQMTNIVYGFSVLSTCT